MAVTLYRKIYLFPLKHQFTNGHLIFDKEIKNIHWGEKTAFSTNGVGQTGWST